MTHPHEMPPPPGQAAWVSPVPEAPWRRLSPRMLLVHPVKALQALLPVLVVALLGTSRADGVLGEVILGVGSAVLAVLLSLISWRTTLYRIDAERLQRREGLLSRNVVTVSLHRIRGVDVEAKPLMRVLGLATVKIGTGVDDTRIELEGLPRAEAESLRAELLHRAREARAEAAHSGRGETLVGGVAGEHGAGPGDADASDQRGLHGPEHGRDHGAERAPEQEIELARFETAWLRFAPFGFSGLVAAAAAMGFLAQFGDALFGLPGVRHAASWLGGLGALTLVLGAIGATLVLWLVLSTLTYVLGWWGMRLTRHPAGSLHLARGLLTKRALSLEESKVRGVQMSEPLQLRWLRAADLSAVASGVDDDSSELLPVAPRAVAQQVGHAVLGETAQAGPLTMPVQSHGPLARRRLLVGVAQDVALTALAAWALWRFVPWGSVLPVDPSWWWFAAAVGLVLAWGLVSAQDAWRNLGHALTPAHLVSQWGSMRRTRVALERDGIIGWTLRQSIFQRRLGLATLVATTAAGNEHYDIEDLPLDRATALARAATPGLLEQFLSPGEEGPRPQR